jgi:HlyD family secretion protein
VKRKHIPILPFIVLGVVSLSACHHADRTAEQVVIDGTVECDEISVSSKVPGRIQELRVDEGVTVNPGDLLATLESKELDAKVAQTTAFYQSASSRVSQASTAVKLQQLTYTDQLAAAQAQYNAHKEDVRQADENLNQAKANYHTQSETYKRFHGLYEDGVIPKQSEDEYEYRYLAAKAMLGVAESKVEQARHSLKAAQANLEQAQHSALQVDLRQEERTVAAQQAEASHGQMNEALALQSETQIVSPVHGYVSEKIANTGEMVSPGFPLLTIVRANDFKVKVYVDESKFGYLTLGEPIQITIPALANQTFQGKLIRISQAADFATKRATNEQGSFDVRALQLVIKLDDDNRFRNGMTARVTLHAREK